MKYYIHTLACDTEPTEQYVTRQSVTFTRWRVTESQYVAHHAMSYAHIVVVCQTKTLAHTTAM